MGDVAGLHLLQGVELVGSPRRSALATLDAEGRLTGLELLQHDAEIVRAVDAAAPAVLVVDAPLAVPGERGRRDAEAVLAWCDVPAFPVSRRRLAQVHGGMRGPALAPDLRRPGRRVVETLPDAVLRQLAWEREHPPGAAPIPLADYRAAWLGVRPPAYRPKGVGRARRAGMPAAHALIAGAVDLGGWTPGAAGDDWEAIADAARLDALLCAYAALRLLRGAAVVVGTPERGEVALPADANLAARLAATLARLRAEGAVAI
ncbi:DUF429 domain-containing protein [Miltoncostaea marina]|uniref:DUF429 domain-containing protein n=1 Tax=Miltoncostaea marina TaxID=2843215 RepID=UPI001C3E6747|nr:DUF429 domain-containing protein [Miltoncostaea marina]